MQGSSERAPPGRGIPRAVAMEQMHLSERAFVRNARRCAWQAQRFDRLERREAAQVLQHVEGGVRRLLVRRGGLDERENGIDESNGRGRGYGVGFITGLEIGWLSWADEKRNELGVGPAYPTWLASGKNVSVAVIVWLAGGNKAVCVDPANEEATAAAAELA